METPRSTSLAGFCFILGTIGSFAAEDQKPLLTLDASFNSVSYGAVKISPDGQAVAFTTERPDWEANRFRSDIWLYPVSDGTLVQLTRSGKDYGPKWSPDGRWIGFTSSRTEGEAAEAASDKEKPGAQVYVISAGGGEPFPVTFGTEGVHDFD